MSNIFYKSFLLFISYKLYILIKVIYCFDWSCELLTK